MIQENIQFYNMVKEASGIAEAKSYMGSITRQRIRENAFHHAILESKPVNPSDCKRDSNSNSLVYQHWLEPDSGAFVLGWRGESPTAQYIASGLAEIPFNIIASRNFEIKTEDLLYYPFPITKVIEDNIIRDLHEAEDAYFASLCYASTSAAGSVSSYTGTFDKLAMRQLYDSIGRKTLTGSTMLISDLLYNQLVTHGTEFFGSQLNGQVCSSGYTVETFHGRKIVQTIKNRILTRNPYAPKNSGAYAFTNKDVPGAATFGVPYDPFYKIGLNLKGLPVNGEGETTAFPRYPAKDIINGMFDATMSIEPTDALDSGDTNGFTTFRNGGALAGITQTVAADPPNAPTTIDWLGNTALCFADEEAVGKSLLLKDVEFEIEQREWKLRFAARKMWGVGVVNVNGVSQVTLAPVL